MQGTVESVEITSSGAALTVEGVAGIEPGADLGGLRVSVELNPALLQPGPAGATERGGSAPARSGGATPEGPSFADALKQATGAESPGSGAGTAQSASTAGATTPSQGGQGAAALRFSKHALERAQRRGIPLDAATLGRLQEGVSRIGAKGSRDSLVLVDGTGFVVSVNNRTVITAVGAEHMREHVFTNIDSAVIA